MSLFLRDLADMELSVVIVSYNTKKLTLKCLQSLWRHSYSGEFEVIVVDNGSTDGSSELIKNFMKGDKKSGLTSELIASKENLGFSRGSNLGIKSANGKHILLLNSDTEVRSGALDALVGFADRNLNVGVVGSKLFNGDGTLQGSVYRLPTLARAVSQYWFGNKLLNKYAPKGEDPLEVESVVGASFLITAAAKEKVGFLDERYFMYFEDLEYCRRVWRRGLGVYYLPASQVVHHHGASGKNISGDQRSRIVKSAKIYYGFIGFYLMEAIIKVGRRLRR